MSDYDDRGNIPEAPHRMKVKKFPLPHLVKKIIEQDQAQEERSIEIISLKHKSK